MTAMVAPQYMRRSHSHSSSSNLLNLDCSADLKSYRRDLGPGVQAKCFEKTSDTIRAQLDQHRAVLLRHRQSGQSNGFPSPVPRLEIPRQHVGPGNNFPSLQTIGATGSFHTASQPQPLRFLSQPHAPQQTLPSSRPQSPIPIPENIDTYPTGLRRALEECAQYGHRYEPDTAWEVFVDTKGTYMEGSYETVGAYDSLQEANMEAAKYFVSDYYDSRLEDPGYEAGDNGCLRINVMTDGSMGGYTTIQVRKVVINRRRHTYRLG